MVERGSAVRRCRLLSSLGTPAKKSRFITRCV
jgi:hypothetical protein